jgi:hypothetical protein
MRIDFRSIALAIGTHPIDAGRISLSIENNSVESTDVSFDVDRISLAIDRSFPAIESDASRSREVPSIAIEMDRDQ